MNTFPVNYSTLDTKALLQLIIENYEVDANATITFLKRGFNDTYLITKPDGKKYIFRVYNNNRRTIGSINTELVILSMMKDNTDIGISYPIEKKTDGLIIEIKAPEGVRTGVLFSYAEGEQIRKLSTEQAYILGREAARIHNFSLTFEGGTTGHNYDIASQFKLTLTILKPILKDFPEQYDYLVKLQKDFINTFIDSNMEELAYGICHGDLQAENIHFTNYNRITIFDFDFIGKGFLAYDIGVFIWYDHKNKTPEIINSFLEGYQTERKLSPTELKLIPYFSTLRALFQMTLYCQTNDGHYLPQWQPKEVAAFVNKIKSWHEKEVLKYWK